MHITAHIDKSTSFLDAWEGFIAVRLNKGDQAPLYTVSTHIHRPNRADAKRDANLLLRDMTN